MMMKQTTRFAALAATAAVMLSSTAAMAETLQINVSKDMPTNIVMPVATADLTGSLDIQVMNPSYETVTFLIPGKAEVVVPFGEDRTVSLAADEIDAANGINYAILDNHPEGNNYVLVMGKITEPMMPDPAIAERDARFAQFSSNSQQSLAQLIARNNYVAPPVYSQAESEAAMAAKKPMMAPAYQPRTASKTVRGYW
ncbi:MAG: hypothetical protein VKJ06_09100 [Vampirovibrionales bacterium]|nr:hypothetical protein [Vampirovibrionales bacterium]